MTIPGNKFVCYLCPKCKKEWGDKALINKYSNIVICDVCHNDDFDIWDKNILKCKNCNNFIKFTYKNS
jgi:hypothetical protein